MQLLAASHRGPAQPLQRAAALSSPTAQLSARLARPCCHARLAPAPAPSAAVLRCQPHLTGTVTSRQLLAAGRSSSRAVRPRSRQCGVSALPVVAMVNVDVSPSVVLGVGLIGAGVSLWQIRRVKPWISKDYDVVVSCISLLVGGILIFQGWRLDPLLLFGQLMTTGAAVSFAIEALRLRSEMYESEEKAALQDVLQRKGGPGGGGSSGSSFQLPPPDAQQQQQPWAQGGSEQAWAQQWQQPPPQQQQQDAGVYGSYTASGSGYGYDQQQQQYGSNGSMDGSGGGQWGWGQGPAGPYQVADYEVPAGSGSGSGADVSSSSGGGFYGGGNTPSSSSSGVQPTEFMFPASYGEEEGGSGSSGGWGGYGPGSEPQAGGSSSGGSGGVQQQSGGGGGGIGGPAGRSTGRGSSYDMDDW